MRIIPDIDEDISEATVNDVKDLMEVAQLRIFKDSVREDELNDVSKSDLIDAKEFAKQKQNKTEEFVKEKSRLIQTAAGVGAVSVGGESTPINFSVSGMIGAVLFAYSRLFSREVDLRKSIIEKSAYQQITGNEWRDNWRHQRNLRLYHTKIVFQMFFTFALYEMNPMWVQLSWESRLRKREGKKARDWLFELAEIYQGERDFDRLIQERQAINEM